MKRLRANALFFVVLATSTLVSPAWAIDAIRVPLSVSGGAGSLEDKKLGYPSRSMGALSIEAFPGIQWRSWLLGGHFDYRMQSQYTSLAEAGETNWAGNSYFVGLGARRDFDRWFIQGAIDLFGRYDLNRNSSRDEDTAFTKPFGLRVKAGYAPFEKFPQISVHVALNYLAFKEFEMGSKQQNSEAQQLMAMAGVTFELGRWSNSKAIAAPAEVEQSLTHSKAEDAAQEQKLAKIIETKRTSHGLMLNLKGEMSFASESAELSASAQDTIRQAAEILAANAEDKIRIEGHTDSSGNKEKNKALSKARAESVKAVLVRHGVKPENVVIEGLGDSRPIQPNKTIQGRAANRRVEIYVDYAASNESRK